MTRTACGVHPQSFRQEHASIIFQHGAFFFYYDGISTYGGVKNIVFVCQLVGWPTEPLMGLRRRWKGGVQFTCGAIRALIHNACHDNHRTQECIIENQSLPINLYRLLYYVFHTNPPPSPETSTPPHPLLELPVLVAQGGRGAALVLKPLTRLRGTTMEGGQ